MVSKLHLHHLPSNIGGAPQNSILVMITAPTFVVVRCSAVRPLFQLLGPQIQHKLLYLTLCTVLGLGFTGLWSTILEYFFLKGTLMK